MRPNGCVVARAYTPSAAVREIACAAARVCVRTAMCARVAAQMRAWGGARLRPHGCGCAPLQGSPRRPGSRCRRSGRCWSRCRPCGRAVKPPRALAELVEPLPSLRAPVGLVEPLPSLAGCAVKPLAVPVGAGGAGGAGGAAAVPPGAWWSPCRHCRRSVGTP